MILIQRGKEPDSLLKYRKKPDACYERIEAEASKAIRQQMWEEQGGLCAYCIRQIKSPRDVRIEHYTARHPQDGTYEAMQTLNFKEMLGVCYGNSIRPGVKYEDRTCDAHRGNTPLNVNPFDIHSIRKIKYSSDGYITSDDKGIRTDVEETLNLNCRACSLPENWKNVLIQTKREIKKACGSKSHDAYLMVLRRIYKRYTEQRILTPYCGITIAWLEKELGIN